MNGVIFNFSPSAKGASAFIADKIYKYLLIKNLNVEIINIHSFRIFPCGDCTEYCYKHGECQIKNDDMWKVYEILTTRNFFIFITPVYFYHLPGYAKVMIDRCQPYWVRKYVLNNFELSEKFGALVCIGATKGKKLFSGINLTIKYFFDIFNIKFNKKYNLYLRNVETVKDVKNCFKQISQYVHSLFIKINKDIGDLAS